MAWKTGPLPPDTYGWGGVVLVGQKGSGFYFADFCGDHVKTIPGDTEYWRRVAPHEIALYDNSLEAPPGVASRVGGE